MDWLEVAKTFGVPVAILAAMMFAAWRTLKWFGAEVVIPIRDAILNKAIHFFDKLDVTVEKIETNVDSVTRNMDVQTRAMESQARTLEKIERKVADCPTPTVRAALKLNGPICEGK